METGSGGVVGVGDDVGDGAADDDAVEDVGEDEGDEAPGSGVSPLVQAASSSAGMIVSASRPGHLISTTYVGG